MKHRSPFALLAAALFLVAGCGGDAETEGEMPGEAPAMEEEAGAMEEEAGAMEGERRVEIAVPADGATVEGPQVTVELEAYGFQVVEAGDTTSNSGHHHLFLDRDVSPASEPIPAEEGHIVHMGDGSTSFTFENVEPGQHTLIAVVGDAFHEPVPGLQDTIQFTVE